MQQQRFGYLHQQNKSYAAGWMQQQRQLNLWQHDGACACMICVQGQQNRSLESQVKQLQQQVGELTLQLGQQKGAAGAAVSAKQVRQMVQERVIVLG